MSNVYQLIRQQLNHLYSILERFIFDYLYKCVIEKKREKDFKLKHYGRKRRNFSLNSKHVPCYFFYIICLQVCTSYLECYARIEIVGYVYLHCSYVNTKCMINISRASLPSGSSCDSKVKINMKYMIMSANMNFLSDQAIFTNALLQNPLYISTFHKMNFNSHLLSNLTA